MQLNHKPKHHPHERAKRPPITMNYHSDNSLHGYGIDLPAFAFDYSEYFVNAMVISRQYLIVTMLGHRVIFEDYPIDAISTDMEILQGWHELTKHWHHHFGVNNLVSGSTHTTRPQPFFCIMHNHNDHIHSKPFQVQAQWLRIQGKPAINSSDSSLPKTTNYNRHIEILVCPLHRNYSSSSSSSSISQGVQQQQQQQQQQQLDVDIVRRNSNHSTTPNLPYINLISFHVPLLPASTLSSASSSGVLNAGYPAVATTTASSSHSSTISSNSSSHTRHNEKNTDNNYHPFGITVCIPSIHLAASSNEGGGNNYEIGYYRIVQMIQSILQLRKGDGGDGEGMSIQQIILGVMATRYHPRFLALQALLDALYSPSPSANASSSYPSSSPKILLVPLSTISDHQDVYSYHGIIWKDSMGEVFFLQYCLQLAKAQQSSTHLLVIRPNQLLIPQQQGDSGGLLYNLYFYHIHQLLALQKQQKQQQYVIKQQAMLGIYTRPSSSTSSSSKRASASSSSGSSSNSSSSSKWMYSTINAKLAAQLNYTKPCSIQFMARHDYAFESSPRSAGTQDYDRLSYQELYNHSSDSTVMQDSMIVSLYDLDEVIALDVSSEQADGRRIMPICRRKLTNYHHRHHPLSSSSNTGDGSNNAAGNSNNKQQSSSSSTQDVHWLIPSSIATVNTYHPPLARVAAGTAAHSIGFGSSSTSISTTSNKAPVSKEQEALHKQTSQQWFEQIDDAILQRMMKVLNLSSARKDQLWRKLMTIVDQKVKEQQHRSTQDHHLDNNNHDSQGSPSSSGNEASGGSGKVMKYHKDIKPPFWHKCDVAHLSEVLKRVFNN